MYAFVSRKHTLEPYIDPPPSPGITKSGYLALKRPTASSAI